MSIQKMYNPSSTKTREIRWETTNINLQIGKLSEGLLNLSGILKTQISDMGHLVLSFLLYSYFGVLPFLFYCLYKGGGVMSSQSWLILAGVFFGIGVLILFFMVILAIHWWRNEPEDEIPETLKRIEQGIARIEVIEKDRDEKLVKMMKVAFKEALKEDREERTKKET